MFNYVDSTNFKLVKSIKRYLYIVLLRDRWVVAFELVAVDFLLSINSCLEIYMYKIIYTLYYKFNKH